MALVVNNLGCDLLQGCVHEAERANRVAHDLEAIRQAIPPHLHPFLTSVIVEVSSTSRGLRDLADRSQVYMARFPLIKEHLNVVLPCLARTLIDIERYYSDKTESRDRRWRKMYHEMSNEVPGTTLPARFVMYNQFLELLQTMLVMSPNFDANALELLTGRILYLRDVRNIAPPSPIARPPRWPDLLEYWEDGTNSHWAEAIFARQTPTRTRLEKPRNPISQAFGPFERLGHPPIFPDAKHLIKRSFDHDRLSATFFLEGYDETPWILIRTIQGHQPWVALKGVHELVISQHDHATLNLARWSRLDDRSKPWAALKFNIWEDMVLFYCTFVCLKARSLHMISMNFNEFVLQAEKLLFRAHIRDDDDEHALIVYQDRHTGCRRLQAIVIDRDLENCPIWTAFLPAVTGRSRRPWIDRRSRHRVWLRGIHPYVFCETYRAQSQRKGKSGAFFELAFVHEMAATHFVKVFEPEAVISDAGTGQAAAGD